MEVYSKVIARNVNNFVPLGDDQFQSCRKGSLLMDPQPHPLLHFLVRMKPTSRNVFCKVAKNVEVTGERSGLYGWCWSVSQPNLWSLSLTRLIRTGVIMQKDNCFRHHYRPFLLYCASQHPHPSGNEHISLLFFACLHFQCWTNTLYTTLTYSSMKKQLCGPVRFHYLTDGSIDT